MDNLVLSDPKKKAHYDKYGTVDDDNFNFEEFMKGFHFDFPFDIFDPDLGKKVMILYSDGADDDWRNA